MLTKQQTKDLERWYPLDNMKAAHYAYDASTKRFQIAKAGRRSYKTEIAKRKLIRAALEVPGNYFIAAPTIPQVRLIYWDDIKRMSFPSIQNATPKEALLTRPFDNGSTIQLLGMENPKRFEGPYWTGGILDEFAYFKPEAWAESIRPALDTVIPGKPLPWCIILSKPNGLNHFHDLYQFAKTGVDPNWEVFEWTSEDVLSEEACASARRELSLRQYRQEYLGEFVTQTGRIYDEYGPLNYTSETILPHEQIHYFCDFNYTPMSHGIAVIRNDVVFILDEVILTSAEGHMNVTEFCEKYKEHKNKSLLIFGDTSGKAGEKHSLESEYILMEREFKKYGWTTRRKVKNANPGIKDRHNCVNALIKSADGTVRLFVNPSTAPWAHKGLLTTVFKEGSVIQEEQKANNGDRNEYQHITTGIGYMCDYLYPIKHTRNMEDYQLHDIYGVEAHASY